MMKQEYNFFAKYRKSRKKVLFFALIMSLSCVFTAAVSTYAWFQANSPVTINTESDSATITVSRPEGIKFYYFTGNGTPGGDYTGYSRSDSVIGQAPRVIAHDGSTNPTNVSFDEAAEKYYFKEITEAGVYTSANCFNLSKIRPGCYYSYCFCGI